MKITIFLLTRTIKDPFILLGQDYLKKCRYPWDIKSVFIDNQDDFLKKSKNHYRIALCEDGQAFTSLKWAQHLDKIGQQQSKIAFLIGGAQGLSKDIIEISNETLGLSDFTLPHRLAFLLLCEQLFRSQEISKNSPYHK